ncbi:hypothetical protein X801_00680 [Opisthorchis viverrini]|uniref:Rab-GAP TBC domain-containing protein n=1 Tax=Opisthorchis viverrini TaxID=6198 RepID=A0A1S8X9P1_OPIVI|nr:hypothetical protein X801_00680 [Opisthorchis viverrini]
MGVFVRSVTPTQSVCPSGPYASVALACCEGDRTTSLHAIKLDVSRTFPALGLFQPGNPLHSPLHDLLAAYVAYKPEIGYVQGMSFLAAILLLVMDNTFEAFVMFANILERPCHRAFYSLDEAEFAVTKPPLPARKLLKLH